MLFALMGTDKDGAADIRQRVRGEHLDRVRALQDAGRLVIAGPHPRGDAPQLGPAGVTGSLIIAEFASRAAAEQWWHTDPYALNGVFTEQRVLPFIQVLP
jgi:uncharacterized protein